MTATTTAGVDLAAVRDHLRPGGDWAVKAGDTVRRHRIKIPGLTETRLAADVGVTAQTIKLVEAGQMVPRDYLRASIAWALGLDVDDIWPSLTRADVQRIGAMP